MPRPMTEDERQDIPGPTHIGVLSVAGGDGRPPHSTPVWYSYTPGAISRLHRNRWQEVTKGATRSEGGDVEPAGSARGVPVQVRYRRGHGRQGRPPTLCGAGARGSAPVSARGTGAVVRRLGARATLTRFVPLHDPSRPLAKLRLLGGGRVASTCPVRGVVRYVLVRQGRGRRGPGADRAGDPPTPKQLSPRRWGPRTPRSLQRAAKRVDAPAAGCPDNSA